MSNNLVLAATEVNVWYAIGPVLVTALAGIVVAYIQARNKRQEAETTAKSESETAVITANTTLKSEEVAAAAAMAQTSLEETKVVIDAWKAMTIAQGERINVLTQQLAAQDQRIRDLSETIHKEIERRERCDEERSELQERIEALMGVVIGYKLWPENHAVPDPHDLFRDREQDGKDTE